MNLKVRTLKRIVGDGLPWKCLISDAFLDAEKLQSLDLIVPVWTMGTITKEQLKPVMSAVAAALVWPGAMGHVVPSADTDWQFMTGGQWVAHPVMTAWNTRSILSRIKRNCRVIEDFKVKSEQYYSMWIWL